MTAAVAGRVAGRAAPRAAAAAAPASAAAGTPVPPKPAPAAAPAPKRPPIDAPGPGRRPSRIRDTAGAAAAGAAPVARGAAGFLVALVVWGWVVMPFIQDGPAGVRKVLAAKFLNKTPEGEWLP